MSSMNKKELVNSIAGSQGLSKTQALAVVEEVFKSIINAVASGTDVQIPGFGSFKKVHRKARKGHNPSTGAEIDIPASEAVKFTVSKAFKEEVNQ